MLRLLYCPRICLTFPVTSYSDALLSSSNTVWICSSLLYICFLRYSPAMKMEMNNFSFHKALSFGQDHGQATLESVVRLSGAPNQLPEPFISERQSSCASLVIQIQIFPFSFPASMICMPLFI